MKMPIAERFVSINGEGRKAGELCQFIRFAGCNLQCSYCDTAWSQAADSAIQHLEVSSLVADAEAAGITNITLTGGEPLLQKRLHELIRRLMTQGHAVEIETNGSLPLDELLLLRSPSDDRLSFTLDYKLPDSGMEAAMCLNNLSLVGFQDVVKFVASSHRDLERAAEIIAEYQLAGRTQVYLSSAAGQLPPADIVEFMKTHRLNRVRLQLQLHKYIWDPTQRGV